MPAIAWPEPAPIVYGAKLGTAQLNATASLPGTFAYTPQIGAALGAGKHMLAVTFTATDTANYTTAQAEVSLSVTKAKPDVTWPSPRAISYGTALSSAQLNAKTSIPGTFVYTPAAGTLLSVGAQTLSMTFIPSDTINYTTEQASVSIEVEEARFAASYTPTKAETEAEELFQFLKPFRIDTEDQERRAPVTYAAVSDEQQSLFVPRIVADYSAIEEMKKEALYTADDFILKRQPETRIYKGASYTKGADGKWHLEK